MMLHLHALLLRAALAASCAGALAAPGLREPEARALELGSAPSAAPPFAAVELAELAELERTAGDLEHLRGGDLHLSTEETILVILGVAILIVLVA